MVWDDLSRKGSRVSAHRRRLAWRRDNRCSRHRALTPTGAATLSATPTPNRFRRGNEWSLWGVLGVTPLIGRVFTEEEDEKGVRVVVISPGLWQRRYAGRPICWAARSP